MAVDLVLSPLISLLVEKAAGSLVEQFCRMRGMEGDHKKLQRQLLAIQEKIVHAEKRAGNSPLVQAWLKELRAVAYQAVNVLDEFHDEALHQQPSLSYKVKNLLFRKKGAVFRFNMSKKLKNILEKIDEIVTEMHKFNFVLCERECMVDRPLTCSLVNEAEVIGRDSDKEEIINVLLDLQHERENLSIGVLPIVGTRGLGKTTLAQLVYNDKKVEEHFELLVWICVSNECNLVNIVRSIIEVVTNGEDISTSNIEVLQHRLRGILAGKKYLLVLDDVSIDEVEKWDLLKTLLLSGDCSGSVIIVTTCSKRVASIVETLPSYNLSPLNEEHSWELFQKRAFKEGVGGLPELVEIARTIVCNCAGSPRALKEIGTLLSSKREVGEWQVIAENCLNQQACADENSSGIPIPVDFNFSQSLELMRYQGIINDKRTNKSVTANFILNNSIYKWQRSIGFNSSLSSSLHSDIDTLLFRLKLSDPEAQHSAAGAIRLLTRRGNGSRLILGQAGVVPLLNNLLSSPDSHIQEHAVTALLNLSICEDNKARIIASGSATMIVHTLKTGNMEARENSAAALYSLSLVDQYKVLIGATWAIPALVSLLNEGTLQGKKDALVALFNLCIYLGNKWKAVRAGVLPLLMRLMTEPSGYVTDEALATLTLLSNDPKNKITIRKAEPIPDLVDMVRSGSSRNRENAASVLVNICNGEGGDMYIHQAAECGLLGAIRDLAVHGTDRGKRKAALLEDMINQYFCSDLDLNTADQSTQQL